MSNISIENNNRAIGYICDAITEYNELLDQISNGNDNPRINKIMDEIRNEIEQLKDIKSSINVANKNISSALVSKEKNNNQTNSNSNISSNELNSVKNVSKNSANNNVKNIDKKGFK